MIQLASVLQAVISQQLIPTMDGTLIPVFEIMEVTPAIRNMIRENKVHQIDGLIYSSTGSGMISMDQSLINLYKEGQISKETAILYASNPEMIIKGSAKKYGQKQAEIHRNLLTKSANIVR